MINLFSKFKYRIVELDNMTYEVHFKRRFNWIWEKYNTWNSLEQADKFVNKNIREDKNKYKFIIYYY